MLFDKILRKALEKKISDVHLTVGLPPIIRLDGRLINLDMDKLMPKDLADMVKNLLDKDQMVQLDDKGDVDISYSITKVGRFRINIFKQRGSFAIAVRVVDLEIPEIDDLGLPSVIKEFSDLRRGLVLVTGPTGSGKSTTLAAMINRMNQQRHEHIITIEDPIEFLHKHKKCIINQREIGEDSKSFSTALISSLRQDPDIILVGEMRDLDTISTAITAAETGHLVLSTVHTIGAANTIERIVDVFPSYQQEQIKVQLASVLKGVITQQIMPKAYEDGRTVAFEIMRSTPAVQNLIREGKTHQINTILQTKSDLGMRTMDSSLIDMYKNGEITKDTVLKYAVDRKNTKKRIEFM